MREHLEDQTARVSRNLGLVTAVQQLDCIVRLGHPFSHGKRWSLERQMHWFNELLVDMDPAVQNHLLREACRQGRDDLIPLLSVILLLSGKNLNDPDGRRGRPL